jgi:phospholipase/lecithinase/hemolysin
MSAQPFTFALVWIDRRCLLENSVGNAYYRTNASTFVPQLIGRLEDLAKDIYNAGGRKFLLVNVPPINRTPMFIQQGDWAIEHSAAYLAVYNQQLAIMVERFKSSNTGVRCYFVYLEIVVLTRI